MVLTLMLFVGRIFSHAQIIRAGLTAGVQCSWVKLDDASFRDTVKINPLWGFSAGAVLSFKVKDRYFLHTEYVYSQKGKIAKGKKDDYLKDRVRYHYIDIPVLFTMHFKATLNNGSGFKWYVGAGPNISYFLGGKGAISASELKDDGVEKHEYPIYFEKRPDDTQYSDNVYYPDVNRLQFGLNVGFGIMLEPFDRHKVMIDFRYSLDQTRISRNGMADYSRPLDYDDNLKARNRYVRASLIYLIEYNLDKKSRHKGKSTVKDR